MDSAEWWPRLGDGTRAWLVGNNGDALPPAVLTAITAAGGVAVSDAWWVGQNGPDGFFLSHAAVDWIEEKANDE